jgi:copper oxidase (laccase) domain-containing protein
LGETVEVMTENYGTRPADLLAIVSPSLGPCCGEFVNYKEELPPEFHSFMVRDNHFDFWRISEYQLTAAGLAQNHIRIMGTCTACSPDYFSYRRAKRESGGLTGRNCSVITLRNE